MNSETAEVIYYMAKYFTKREFDYSLNNDFEATWAKYNLPWETVEACVKTWHDDIVRMAKISKK